MYRVIELDNGLKFAQLSKVEHENNKYLFVVSLTESPKFLFLERGKNKEEIIPIEDGKLILKLTQIVQEQISKQAQAQMENNKTVKSPKTTKK